MVELKIGKKYKSKVSGVIYKFLRKDLTRSFSYKFIAKTNMYENNFNISKGDVKYFPNFYIEENLKSLSNKIKKL